MRVGAILGQTKNQIKFLGYGVYEGDFPVPQEQAAVGVFGMPLPEEHKNPRLRLDNGDIVWGCESWWGSEEKIRNLLEKHEHGGGTVVTVSIVEERARVAEERTEH
jgi:hypothetical protein